MEHKICTTKTSSVPGSNRVLRFIASTEDVDRDGDSIAVSGWDLTTFKQDPVFIWSHCYSTPSIGKVINIQTDTVNKKLICDVQFPSVKELAPDSEPSEHAKFTETVYNLYKGGYLNAVSVGCSYDEASPNATNGYNVTKATLLELSGCVVPANQNALRVASSKGNIEKKSLDMVVKSMKIESKAAIPYKKYPLADADTAWNGPGVTKDADTDDLAIMCTWKADKKPEDLTKADFKLPHHLGKSDGYKTVQKGVVAAVGALHGARTAIKIPDADLPDVETHLKKHYADFDMDWPADKAAWVAQCKSLGIKFKNVTKSGARLSADTSAHLDNIEACMKELDGHMANMKACHGKTMKCIQKLRNGEAPGNGDGNDQEEPGSGDSGDMASEDDKGIIGGVYPANPAFTDEGFINIDFSQ